MTARIAATLVLTALSPLVAPRPASADVHPCDLVRRADVAIELTAKEYAVLEYLMSSAGRVFSRTMILEHVWDQSFEGVTNIVDVYVRHLRRKVDDPFPVKLIHTVRGVGYCVREAQQLTETE